MNTIEELSTLTSAEFNATYYNVKPVIYKGGAINSKSFLNWTPEYLISKIGDTHVKVNYSESGVYNYTVAGQTRQIEGPFSQMMDHFTSESYNNKSYYLQQTSISENFPELVSDVEPPALIAEDDILKEVNLWVGGKGCLTPLHFDQSQNFLVQIKGRKEIVFFSPADSVFLYPRTDQNYHISQVDIENIDIAKFPLYANAANKYTCVLEAGDIIYIPPGWWHQVRSLDTSVSVNYWFYKFDVFEAAGMELIGVDDLCEIFSLFIGNGLTLEHKDRAGEHLFIKAVCLNYPNFVEAFLKMGLSPQLTSCMYAPGKSALELAKEKGLAEIEVLLNHYSHDLKVTC
jgi:tRNA wybutosine-synthesizing protein 5